MPTITFGSWSNDSSTVWNFSNTSVITYTPGTTFLGGATATISVTVSGSTFLTPVFIACTLTGPVSGFNGSALLDISTFCNYNSIGTTSVSNGVHTLKATLGTATPGAGTVTWNFSYDTGGGNTPLCWTLTCMRKNGKLFQTSGAGRLPSDIKVPPDCDPSTSIVYEDGIFIPQRYYKLVHNGVPIEP